MKNTRRRFLKTAALAGVTPATLSLASCTQQNNSTVSYPDYSALDRALEEPVLKKELFSSPVIIEKLELLNDRNNFICRVRSQDGGEGISVGNRLFSGQGYPMFKRAVHPPFIGIGNG
jgi:hypothetical protein